MIAEDALCNFHFFAEKWRRARNIWYMIHISILVRLCGMQFEVVNVICFQLLVEQVYSFCSSLPAKAIAAWNGFAGMVKPEIADFDLYKVFPKKDSSDKEINDMS